MHKQNSPERIAAGESIRQALGMTASAYQLVAEEGKQQAASLTGCFVDKMLRLSTANLVTFAPAVK